MEFISPKNDANEIMLLEHVGVRIIRRYPGSDYYLGYYERQQVLIRIDQSQNNFIHELNERTVRFTKRALIHPANIVVPKIFKIITNTNPNTGEKYTIVISDTPEGLNLFELIKAGEVTPDIINLWANFIHQIETSPSLGIATLPMTIAKSQRSLDEWTGIYYNKRNEWKEEIDQFVSDNPKLVILRNIAEFLYDTTEGFRADSVGHGGLHGRVRAGNVAISHSIKERDLIWNQLNWEEANAASMMFSQTVSSLGNLVVWHHMQPNTLQNAKELLKARYDLLGRDTTDIRRRFRKYIKHLLAQRLLGDITDIMKYERTPDGVLNNFDTLGKVINGLVNYIDAGFPEDTES